MGTTSTGGEDGSTQGHAGSESVAVGAPTTRGPSATGEAQTPPVAADVVDRHRAPTLGPRTYEFVLLLTLYVVVVPPPVTEGAPVVTGDVHRPSIPGVPPEIMEGGLPGSRRLPGDVHRTSVRSGVHILRLSSKVSATETRDSVHGNKSDVIIEGDKRFVEKMESSKG